MENENQYLVTWQIDMWASTPEEAARKALQIMRTPGSTANVFEVQQAGKTEVHKIDLELRFMFPVGTRVIVPEPDETDIHHYSCQGHVIGYHDKYIVVEDGEGDAFDIEPHRLSLEEEEE